MDSDTELINDLFEIGSFKVGDFSLKSGQQSPFYFDLRVLVSFPLVLQRLSRAMNGRARSLSFDRMAAIPYAALPIGTAMSLESGKPLIYPRKEVKSYGTKKPIEGLFTAGETVLVIDDLITTGLSKKEAILPLRDAGLVVKDILVVIDREQGGPAAMKQEGWTVHSLFTVSQILHSLHTSGKISESAFNNTLAYLKENR